MMAEPTPRARATGLTAAGGMATQIAAQIAADENFAHHRYFDPTFKVQGAKVLPGEFYVTNGDEVIVTVLGSCVAACIRDPRLGLGGMNHFMLPDSDSSAPASTSARYGTYAMEMLINSLLKMGARRESLEAKVFGGGNVLANMTHTNVGQRNSAFVLDFLGTERIRVVAKDLEDVHPRKVYYFPATGKVMVKKLRSSTDEVLLNTEREYQRKLQSAKVGGDIELFG